MAANPTKEQDHVVWLVEEDCDEGDWYSIHGGPTQFDGRQILEEQRDSHPHLRFRLRKYVRAAG